MFRCWLIGRANRKEWIWACARRCPIWAKPLPKISGREFLKAQVSSTRSCKLDPTPMRRPILAGNWKMYKNVNETKVFFDKFKPLVATSTHCDIVICPTFVNLQAAVEATHGATIEIGGQNLFWEKEGAYTGEISGGMLRALGCRWVLVAHSERRQYFGETNDSARKKLVAALGAGLTPVYCLRENLREREAD